MRTSTLFLFVILLVTSCNRNKFLTADYDKYAANHQTIAVLPYEIIMSGRALNKLSEGEINKLILSENKLFQQSLYGEVLERSGSDGDDINVSVQAINKTNRLLNDNQITSLNISEYSPKELGEILNVDAVIITKLRKEVFLTREEALLAEVGTEVLSDVLGSSVPSTILTTNKSKLSRSSEIDIYCTIMDTESETAIWAYDTDFDLAWDIDPDDAVEKINRRISRKFPYRRNK